MPANVEVKAASYYGPRASVSPSNGDPGLNPIRFGTSSTAASQALNADTLQDGSVRIPWQGKYVDHTNESATDALDVAYSAGAPVTLVFGQVSASFAAGSAVAGERLQPGERRSWMVPNDATHFNYVLGGAGPSSVCLRCSEANAGNK